MVLYKTLVTKISVPSDKKIKEKNYLNFGIFPIIDQGKDLVGGYSNDQSSVLKCDLPVVIFGDHTKVVKYIHFPFGAGADGIKVLQPKATVLPKYLYYGTQYLALTVVDKGYARHYQYIEKMDLFLPPLSEQERIVARIEELFSAIDKGVETLHTLQRQLAVYRQAIVTAIFLQFDSGNMVKLADISEITGGITKGRKLYGQETIQLPYLRVANVQNGYLDLSEIKKIELKVSEQSKYTLRYGDVLYTEGGDKDKLGRGTIWRDEIPCCVHQNHIFKARIFPDKALPQYVAYWSQSTTAKYYFHKHSKQTTNLASINKTVLSGLPLPLPDLEVQQKVVSKIESRLSLCDKIEQIVDQSLRQAEALRQSILRKAFSGELQ